MLAALGRFFRWPRRELEALTDEDARWWWKAMLDFLAATKSEGASGA